MSDSCNNNSTTSLALRRKIKKGATFNYDFVNVASRLVAAGMTEKDIGYVLGVKPTTIKKWKQRYEEFKLACKDGKEVAKQYIIANGLRAATGYDYEEVDVTHERNLEGKLEIKKKTVKLRHRPVDKDLLMFFLINLDKDFGNWRNVKSIEVEHTNRNINVDLTGQIESDTIRKLAGAAIKEADKIDTIKRVESTVIE